MTDSAGQATLRRGHSGISPVLASSLETRIGFRCGSDSLWLLLGSNIPVQVAIDPRLTRIPHTQDWFRGVMSLRGSLYPVYDLGAWLTGTPSELDYSRILVVEPGETGAAVLFHDEPRLLQVRRVQEPPPENRLATFVKNVYRAGDDLAVGFNHRKWFEEAGRDVAARHA